MKRILAFTLCLFGLLLCACQKPPAAQHYFCSDLVKCFELRLHKSPHPFEFFTSLVTTDPDPKVEVVGVKGLNADKCRISLKEILDGTPSYDTAYRGYYYRALGFELERNAPEVTIESLTLNINGDTREYTFKHPLHITFHDSDPDGSPISIRNIPAGDTVDGFMSSRRNWHFHTDEDILVESVAFNELVRLKNIEITIADEEGSPISTRELKDGAPVEVLAGESFTIAFDAESADDCTWSNIDRLFMTFAMKYTEIETGRQREYDDLNAVCASGMIDEEAVQMLIDYAIDQMGD